MATTANIIPTPETDGIPYAIAVPLTPTEADLSGGANVPASPVPVEYGHAIVAVVQLSVNGYVVGQNSYVVMQADLGDGVWVDAAWVVWTGNQGGATFVLCGGGVGAMNNAFQQARAPGQFPQPQAAGSNNVPLGGRVRFVGRSTFVGGSSSLAGLGTAVYATIRYKLLAPR